MTGDTKSKVTALIVTFESRDCIGAALDSLAEAHHRGELECVVVDNASGDGSADFVEASYPWVELVRSPGNIGFGRGCNLGFERVRTPYVLIHNPDAVIDREAIHVLLGFVESRPEAGVVAPSVVYGDGAIQKVGMMTTPASLWRGAFGRSEAIPGARPVAPGTAAFRTDWVCGAMMLMRSELYRRLGGFDPRFFLYFEETDLLRRAMGEGAEIWCVGEAVAQHIGGASARAAGAMPAGGCIPEHFFRSRFYYLVKHFGWFQAVSSELVDWSFTAMRRGRDLLMRRNIASDSRHGRPLLRFPAKLDHQ
jgi:N-acetylglucosaminyl-diphospho-decaprenol L-rhamnosyltransferase